MYQILFHFRQTADERKKIEYLVKAGHFAEARTSFHDAVQFYSEVLTVCEHAPDRFPVELPDIHEHMADSLKHLGNYPEAASHYQAALQATTDRLTLARLYQNLSYAQAAGGRYEDAINTLTVALSAFGERVPSTPFVFMVKLLKELAVQFIHSRIPGRLINPRTATQNDEEFQKQKLFQMIGWVCLWAMKRELLVYSHFKALNMSDRTGISEEGVELLLTHCAVLASIDGPPPVVRLFFKRIDRFMHRIKRALASLSRPKLPYALFLAAYGGIRLDPESLPQAEEALHILRQLHTVTYLQEISNCAAQIFEAHGRFDLLRELGKEVRDKGLLFGNRLIRSIGDLYEGIALTYLGKHADAVRLLESALHTCERASDHVNCQYARMFLIKLYGRSGDYEKAKTYFDRAVSTMQDEHQTHPMVIARIFPFFLEELLERFLPFAPTREEKQRRLRETKRCYRICRRLAHSYHAHLSLFARLDAVYQSRVVRDRRRADHVFQTGARALEHSHEQYQKGMLFLAYADFLGSEDPLAALPLYEKAHLALESCRAFETGRAAAGVTEIHARRSFSAPGSSSSGPAPSGSDSRAFLINRELNTVLAISKRLSIIDDLDLLLEEVLDQAIKLVGAEQGQLFLDQDDRLVPSLHRTARGVDPLPVSRGVVSLVEASGEPLVIVDARNDPRLEMDSAVTEYGLKSILCVPMISHDKRVGVVYVSNHHVGGLFSAHELDLLYAMAGQAAVAIENSRLFREMNRLKVYLQSIIESMPGAIIALDNTGCITYKNSAAIDFFPELDTGRERDTLWHIVPFLAKYHKVFLEVLEENRSVEFQRDTFNKHVVRITIFPLTGKETNGAVLKINDITEQEKLQQHLIQAQKMEALETLVGGLAHDFNNILSGMMMTMDYVKQYVVVPGERFTREDVEEELDIISTSIDRAANLVQQLLTISMRTEINVVSVDLNDAIGRVIRICRQSFDKSIDFKVTQYDGIAAVLADIAQLEQVILNICINASHAMTIMRPREADWGGTLTLHIKRVSLDKPIGNGFTEAIFGDYWCLSIEDTGVGMNDDTIKKIFEPFFITKETGKGSGLGLAMVYSIVKRFNGHINVYSEPGKGTAFHLYFPVEETAERLTDSVPASPLRYQGSGVALVIDDEAFIRRSLERILKRAGYEVRTASNGRDAVRLFSELKDRVTIVLLDMVMPKDSGKMVFKEIMRQKPDSKVILMSGFRKDRRVDEVLASGTCRFLEKPFNQEELFRTINLILE
ncbi:MAG TPA: response regulator [Spirochaetia bacterium]|nr:response regulator [Spirochaetia bacterium]